MNNKAHLLQYAESMHKEWGYKRADNKVISDNEIFQLWNNSTVVSLYIWLYCKGIGEPLEEARDFKHSWSKPCFYSFNAHMVSAGHPLTHFWFPLETDGIPSKHNVQAPLVIHSHIFVSYIHNNYCSRLLKRAIVFSMLSIWMLVSLFITKSYRNTAFA